MKSIDFHISDVHDKIFKPNWDAVDFLNPKWVVTTISSGLNLSKDDFAIISKACSSCGDQTIYVTDVEPVPPHQFTMAIPPVLNDLYRAFGSSLGHFQVHAYGRSGKWGLICTQKDVSYYGIDPSV